MCVKHQDSNRVSPLITGDDGIMDKRMTTKQIGYLQFQLLGIQTLFLYRSDINDTSNELQSRFDLAEVDRDLT
jgi:hypothetical protein